MISPPSAPAKVEAYATAPAAWRCRLQCAGLGQASADWPQSRAARGNTTNILVEISSRGCTCTHCVRPGSAKEEAPTPPQCSVGTCGHALMIGRCGHGQHSSDSQPNKGCCEKTAHGPPFITTAQDVRSSPKRTVRVCGGSSYDTQSGILMDGEVTP